MSKFRFGAALLLLLFMTVTIVSAQGDCPAFVQNTLDSIEGLCERTGRDEACYGSSQIQASGRSDRFQFAAPGDIEDVANIETLRLSSLSLDDEEWGIALLNVQASLPDDSPDDVTILLFGDVTMANAGRSVVEIDATARQDVDILLRPNDSSVVDSLREGDEAVVDGRTEDSDWLRIHIPDGGFGWVPADSLDLDGSADDLVVIEPDEPFYGPMQAFYVETGANDSPCPQAPPSGILIQTPEGQGEINLLINEVDVRLGSTAFIQQSAGTMIFCILEGEGGVEVNGVEVDIPAGGYSTIPIEDLRPAGDPAPLAGYGDADALSALPVDLLPDEIEIAEGLTEEEIEDFLESQANEDNVDPQDSEDTDDSGDDDSGGDAGGDGGGDSGELVPLAGVWEVTGTHGVCHNLDADYLSATGDLIFGRGTLTVDSESFSFTTSAGTSTHTLNGDGSYFLSMESPETPGATDTYQTTVSSPTSMLTIIHHESSATACETIDGTAMWTYVGA
jgi:hypothetical protein